MSTLDDFPNVQDLGFVPATKRREPDRRLPLLPKPKTVDDMLSNLDKVIAWAIDAKSPVGYFAAVYRRASLTIKAAIDAGEFSDRERMTRLFVAFSQRYFDALNTYFHPKAYESPTAAWQWAFTGNSYQGPTILQHLLTGLNAHINLDLAIATADLGVDDLESLRDDFNKINALLASQVSGVLDAMDDLSPWIVKARRLIPDEVGLVGKLLEGFRTAAWTFANKLFHDPNGAVAAKDTQDAWVSTLGVCYLHPGGTMGHIAARVAEEESDNVARNIRALNKIAVPANPIHDHFR